MTDTNGDLEPCMHRIDGCHVSPEISLKCLSIFFRLLAVPCETTVSGVFGIVFKSEGSIGFYDCEA